MFVGKTTWKSKRKKREKEKKNRKKCDNIMFIKEIYYFTSFIYFIININLRSSNEN